MVNSAYKRFRKAVEKTGVHLENPLLMMRAKR